MWRSSIEAQFCYWTWRQGISIAFPVAIPEQSKFPGRLCNILDTCQLLVAIWQLWVATYMWKHLWVAISVFCAALRPPGASINVIKLLAWCPCSWNHCKCHMNKIIISHLKNLKQGPERSGSTRPKACSSSETSCLDVGDHQRKKCLIMTMIITIIIKQGLNFIQVIWRLKIDWGWKREIGLEV